mmetsp:Transcript_2602/g.2857  ORF Transcript_2602/g.2857 Transcript_2602/m.2857 type:complete len:195 (+) Transcript_2602:89-673(+)
MVGQRLPLRVVSELPMAGCSKPRSHRRLPQFARFEIPYKFPRFPQIFGAWIVRRIKKKETGEVDGHPCSKMYDSFLDCARRHPDSYETKCRTEAGKCIACFEQHKGWSVPEGYNYLRFLEHFKVFSEGHQSHDAGPGKFRYVPSRPKTDGAGSVLQFSGGSDSQQTRSPGTGTPRIGSGGHTPSAGRPQGPPQR